MSDSKQPAGEQLAVPSKEGTDTKASEKKSKLKKSLNAAAVKYNPEEDDVTKLAETPTPQISSIIQNVTSLGKNDGTHLIQELTSNSSQYQQPSVFAQSTPAYLQYPQAYTQIAYPPQLSVVSPGVNPAQFLQLGFGMTQAGMYQMQMMQPQAAQIQQNPITTDQPAKSAENKSGGSEPSYADMLSLLESEGYVNTAPYAFNNISPGEEAPTSLPMPTVLQEYMNDLTSDDYTNLYNQLAENYYTNQDLNFEGSEHGHTYSNVDPDEDYNEAEDGEGADPLMSPDQWAEDPEAVKRREELRKQMFSPDYKDCPCCKGYIMNCEGEICKALNMCHCVANRQMQETGAESQQDELQQIPECKGCSCCKGYVYNCQCVSIDKKSMCKCAS